MGFEDNEIECFKPFRKQLKFKLQIQMENKSELVDFDYKTSYRDLPKIQ